MTTQILSKVKILLTLSDVDPFMPSAPDLTHLWTSGHHTTLMEHVSSRLSRHMHICGLLEFIMQCYSCFSLYKGRGSGPPAGLLPFYNLLHVSWRTGHFSWLCLHALDTTLTDTANLLATARIDVPSRMSCTTWATCVGCRLFLVLPLEWKHRPHQKA